MSIVRGTMGSLVMVVMTGIVRVVIGSKYI